MKFFLLSLLLVSCSSVPEKTEEVAMAEEGALDKAMRNKECGIFDQMYDGCKSKNSKQVQE